MAKIMESRERVYLWIRTSLPQLYQKTGPEILDIDGNTPYMFGLNEEQDRNSSSGEEEHHRQDQEQSLQCTGWLGLGLGC